MQRFALAFLLAGCASTFRAASTPEPYHFRIGALDAYALDDGVIDVPNDGRELGLGHSPADVGDLLAANGERRERTSLSIQPLLVVDGARVLLFDAGAGDAPFAHGGRLPRALAATGQRPTDVFISHHHLDHVGGLGALPNATVHMSAPEWARMQSDPETARVAAAIAPRVVTFEPGAQLLPEVKAIATPGHTPGHSSYEITSAGARLFYLGDVAHHSVVSVQRPTWPIEYDEDQNAGRSMRVQTLSALAASGELVYAVHFPFPGIGHVAARGDAFVWMPTR